MASEKEIEAAIAAVESFVIDSHDEGSYIPQYSVEDAARAALEAAEKVRESDAKD